MSKRENSTAHRPTREQWRELTRVYYSWRGYRAEYRHVERLVKADPSMESVQKFFDITQRLDSVQRNFQSVAGDLGLSTLDQVKAVVHDPFYDGNVTA